MNDETPMSRRSFLRGRALGDLISGLESAAAGVGALRGNAGRDGAHHGGCAEGTGAVRHARSFPVLRPPGAVEEEQFLNGCTRCNACIEVCPHDSIILAPERFRRAAGTPMIDPVRQPCRMCEDTPCISACEPGVLRRDVPLRMGVARISPITCLAHQGSFCTVCSEQCPVVGAIEVVAGKPRIVEEECTGCGVCQHACPAPENAVLLMPLAERPSATHDRETDAAGGGGGTEAE